MNSGVTISRLKSRPDTQPPFARQRHPARSLPIWLKVAVLLWVILSTIESIVLVTLPYVDFAIGVMIVGALSTYARGPIQLSATHYAFLVILLLGGIAGGVPLAGVWWAGKLAIIFLITSTFIATPTAGPSVAHAMIASGVIHSLICVGAITGISWCDGLKLGDGRIGTVLSGPGALWRTVVFALSYCLLALLTATSARMIALASCGAALAITAIWCDGSRTALIVLPIALLLTALRQRPGIHSKRLLIAVAACLCILAYTGRPSFVDLEQQPAFSRLTRVLLLDGSPTVLLEDWDWGRLQGIRSSINAICLSPLLGNGMLTTVIELDNSPNVEFDTQVVHNGYLQVWGDFGVFGLLAFVRIIWIWLPQATRTLQRNVSPYSHHTCLRFAAISTLTVFGLSFLLHPVTVTMNDWIAFVGPLTVLASLNNALLLPVPLAPRS